MKILLVYEPSFSDFENPFVPTLKSAMEYAGADVDWGLSLFWESEEKYDYIFFQWPEAIVNFRKVREEDVLCVSARLNEWIARGAKVAYTRHNVRPHTQSSSASLGLYRLVENSADIIFHMGEYSRVQMLEAHIAEKAKHCVVPHHIPESISRDVDKLDARSRLGIDAAAKVILCFGAFRTDDERHMVLDAYKALDIKEKVLLAPSFYTAPVFRRNPFGLARNLIKRIPFVFSGFAKTKPRVPNKDLPLYFSASDAVLIQRQEILNSGNLPMAYYFGRPVVGPAVGNVGEILKQTGNFRFDPKCMNSVVSALSSALSSNVVRVGESNRKYAELNWSSADVGAAIIKVFVENQ